MSLFKEKDDYIKKAFQDIFCRDSDSEDEEFQDQIKAKKSKLEIDEEEPSINDKSLPGTLITSNNDEVDDDAHIDDVVEKEEKEKEEEEASHTDSGFRGSGETVVCIEISDDSECGVQTEPIPYRTRYQTRNKNAVKQIVSAELIQLSSDEESTPTVAVQKDQSYQIRQNSCNQQSIKEQHYYQDHQASPDHFFNLKVLVSGSIKTFRTTNHQKLSKILEEFLLQVHARGHTLVVTLDDKPISLEETPHSLNLSYTDKLHAIEVSPLEERGDITSKQSIRATTPPKAPNEIKVKLQDGNLRHTKEFRICKDQTVDHLKNLYAKEFNIINLDSIKLWFDGELIDEGLTPEELDIEDDCVIDVMIHN